MKFVSTEPDFRPSPRPTEIRLHTKNSPNGTNASADIEFPKTKKKVEKSLITYEPYAIRVL